MITSPWLIAILSTFSIGLNKSYNLIYSIKVAERKNEMKIYLPQRNLQVTTTCWFEGMWSY